ncbi:hypothetical protein GWI33_018984 [Rhynchophorus ferrugineus]|uniref:Uncharacterized protein n=1 Tax=Rhynchophorus ferrugineus TaxID=354439 RepID=A0A834M7G4_RHYFE|nr:hypothetical protein GWI33_018984 [Rhynchophorus ferrugineus]
MTSSRERGSLLTKSPGHHGKWSLERHEERRAATCTVADGSSSGSRSALRVLEPRGSPGQHCRRRRRLLRPRAE